MASPNQRPLFPRLMFITQQESHYSLREQVDSFLTAGGRFLQYRVKSTRFTAIASQGKRLLNQCQEHKARLIINDFVDIAQQIGADGVHLGHDDTAPEIARQRLGCGAIVGATAHNLEELMALPFDAIDYIGLGPFRFTNTKRNLAPILGLKGVESIMRAVRDANITTPIYVVGGVEALDIRELFALGVYGIAVSGGIALASDPTFATHKFLETIEKNLR